jgi:DNA-directed RNA polymerase sigma subunit (sigma70/sigma32)
MATIYYIIDANGKFYSEDKQTRYTALEGSALHEYMTTHRGVTFLKTTCENDTYAVEVPKHMAKEIEAERLHQLYLRGFEEEIQVISMDASTGEDDTDTLESFIADESEDVFASVCRKMEIETLRRALKTLKAKELLVINTMYLGKYVLSEREVSCIIGIPDRTIHDIKTRALEKLKNFFEKNPRKTQKKSLSKG